MNRESVRLYIKSTSIFLRLTFNLYTEASFEHITFVKVADKL